MTSRQDRKIIADIQQAATRAMSLLGQLGPLVWALHVGRQLTGAVALAIHRDPKKYVEVVTAEDLAKREKRKKRVVQLLRELKKHSEEDGTDRYESKGFRETINRTIVVYAVAVLEHFMDQAGERVYVRLGGTQRDWERKRSFTFMCNGLAEKCCDVTGSPHYPQAALMAQVRHIIVHNDGNIDQKFVDNVQCLGLRFRQSQDSTSIVWDQHGPDAPAQCWKDRPFSIAIDEFLIPMLASTQAFVAEAEDRLVTCACRAAEAETTEAVRSSPRTV